MKKALKEEVLLQLLNWELAAYEECAGCRFTALARLAGEPGADANWSGARLEADHAMPLAESFIAQHIVSETRRLFDLA